MGAKFPRNESSRERKLARIFVPESERTGPFRSRERKVQGAKWQGSERAKEQKGQGARRKDKRIMVSSHKERFGEG